MFRLGSSTLSKPSGPTTHYQQVRNVTIGGKKKRITSVRTDMRKFLGPRNFKGMYTKNPFFWSPKDNQPKYMTSYSMRGAIRPGVPNTDWKRAFNTPINNGLKPFSENPYCKSNLLISDEMKRKILEDYYKKKVSLQRIGFNYGISITRIEALIKLDKVERQMDMPPAVGKMARTMEGMFPVLRGKRGNDDMTEIPIPNETRHQRFLTVAESEPFGPVDAASVLNIEPANETLEKLNNHELPDQTRQKKSDIAFIAPQLQGEKAAFKFTNAKVGQVGYRYGASRDDRKHGRKVQYTATGQKVWAH